MFNYKCLNANAQTLFATENVDSRVHINYLNQNHNNGCSVTPPMLESKQKKQKNVSFELLYYHTINNISILQIYTYK